MTKVLHFSNLSATGVCQNFQNFVGEVEDRNTQVDNLKVFEDNETFWKDYTGSGHDKKSLQTQIGRLNTTQKKRKGGKGLGEKGKKKGKKGL